MCFKNRVHLQPCKTTSIPPGYTGSYALLSFVGDATVIESAFKLFNGRLSKPLTDHLLNAGIDIIVKAGTIRRRTMSCYGDYEKRAHELQSELGKCQKNLHGKNIAARAVYELLTEDEEVECFMVMLPLSNYQIHNTTYIEACVELKMLQKFGLSVENTPDNFVRTERVSWGKKKLLLHS